MPAGMDPVIAAAAPILALPAGKEGKAQCDAAPPPALANATAVGLTPEKASRAAAALEIPPVPAGATAPSYIVAEPTPPPVIAPVREQPAEPAKAAPAAIPVVAELATAASGEPLVGPTIKPIVLGADPLPAAAPRRGWWKR